MEYKINIRWIDITDKQILSKPLYTVETHSVEGFAMDWSRTITGRYINTIEY